jgi:uncharacterized membrane protein YeaQ/YmgE (transglycosylase-associated protein family)
VQGNWIPEGGKQLEILWFVLIGLVAGALARLILPGRDPIGIIGTALLGIAGAVIGGLVVTALTDDNDGVGIIGAVVTAVVLLWLYRKFTYGRTSGTTTSRGF